ncbi:MAG: autotransporter strand-loop-strand O-heptosyltransferase [Lentisphaerae bacterium]|nr:autotransporter strand-loop-strand O-heptosyltransferase [Lentisphaerota bacterium]
MEEKKENNPNGMGIVFGDIPKIPTQDAIDGIKFDFNDGLRVQIPKGAKSYRIRFVDLGTKSCVYDTVTPDGGDCVVFSFKKYFIKFRLVISEVADDKLLFMHDFDAADKEVVVRFPVHTLGDTIAWFSYVERFQQKLNCKLICVVSDWFAEIVKNQYPQIKFVSKEEAASIQSYANYNVGLYELGNVTHQPVDHRYVGLHRVAAHIFGVDDSDIPPRFDLSAPRQIKEKYVCIGVQSTSLAKYWNNPEGWDRVVDYLKSKGYRVLCIDKDRIGGKAGTFIRKPEGAEDFTGALPLQQRIDLLKDADFYIGLSSGLSWLAWGCKVPVIMISGFTNPINEYKTPYRVINYNACNSCWNEFKDFNLTDFWHCPRLAGTDRRYECTAMITADQVIDMIDKVIEDIK